MELEKELNEVIKKNLPQHVGEALRERLEQADKDAKEVERLTSLNKTLTNDNARLVAESSKVYEQGQKYADLKSREKELADAIKFFEIEKLTVELAAERESKEFARNVALGLVRNTQYKETIFDTETVVNPPTLDGRYVPPTNTTKNYNKTITEE